MDVFGQNCVKCAATDASAHTNDECITSRCKQIHWQCTCSSILAACRNGLGGWSIRTAWKHCFYNKCSWCAKYPLHQFFNRSSWLWICAFFSVCFGRTNIDGALEIRFIFGTSQISGVCSAFAVRECAHGAVARVRPWFRRQIWCAVKRCSVAFRFNVKKRTITVIQCAAAAKPNFIAEVYTKGVDDGRTELFVFSWHFIWYSKQNEEMLCSHILIGGEYANANKKIPKTRGGAFYGERFIPGEQQPNVISDMIWKCFLERIFLSV